MADDELIDVEALRAKYADLCRKYALLVERLDRRATQELAVYQLGAWGLRMSGAALATIRGGRIILANARFNQLARSIKGPLRHSNGRAPAYPDLRTLLVELAAAMVADRSSLLEASFSEDGSDAVISIRLERVVHGADTVVVAMAEDVTEHARRDQELKRTRESLVHRERLRVLGELAASVAHDLCNTLRGASFHLAPLTSGALPPDQAKALGVISTHIELASELVSRLHDFARTGSMEISLIELDRIIRQAASVVEVEMKAAACPVEVKLELGELPPVYGSVSEVSLMFVNLLRNAQQAMPQGGTITVTAEAKRDRVLVAVADQGNGLDAEARSRLFEPFFTSKGPRGTGLGLWIAHGTMKRLGGSIHAANQPEGGAIFTLEFPLLEVSRSRSRLSVGRRGATPATPSAPDARPPRRVRRSGWRS